MDATKKKSIVSLLMSLIIVFVLCVGLTSCVSSENAEEKKQDATTEEAPVVEETEESEAKDEQKQSEAKKTTESSKSSSESKATSSSSSNKATSSSTSSSSSASSSSGSATTHTHKWVKHDAVYDTEPVYEKRVVCSCGKQFATQDAWSEHNQSLGFGNTHSYSYKSVQVDTKKVLVEEAYYTCSCGATK